MTIFYTYQGPTTKFASAHFALIEAKRRKLSSKCSADIQSHDHYPSDSEASEYRWIGAVPEAPLPRTDRVHSDEAVIAHFKAHGGKRVGARVFHLEIDGREYSIKEIDDRLGVTERRSKREFPITGFQPGSEL